MTVESSQYSVKICADPKCSNLVPPSKNSGVERKYCSERCRSRANCLKYYYRRKQEEQLLRPVEAGIRLCSNETCVNPVPPSRGSQPRLYCSYRCRAQQTSRNYYRRQKGDGDNITRTDEDNRPFVMRYKASTAEAAYNAYKKHLTNCPNGGEELKCPSRFDTYDKQRLCQMHAVLREDWDQVRRWERDRIRWEREVTTETGYWKESSS